MSLTLLFLSILILFLFGASIGSFLGVIVDRYGTSLSFLRGRSVCLSCNTELGKMDLFPLFSYIYLKGECRYCRSLIPKETFFIELLMGLLSLFAAWLSGFFIAGSLFLGIFYLKYLLLLSLLAILLLISLYDLKHFIIPDSFLLAFLLTSLVYSFFFKTLTLHSLFISALSGIGVALPFLAIFLVSRGGWFGFGDVKFIFLIGFFLGIQSGLSAVVISFWIGAAFSLGVLLFNKIKKQLRLPTANNNLTIKSEIPFGPFLALGVIFSLLNVNLFHIL